MQSPVRLYRSSGDDRVAVVSTEPAYGGGGWLIRVAVGVSADKLTGGTTLGPVSDSEVEPRFGEAVEQLRSQGFAERTTEDWNTLLEHEDSRVRARAATRLGWRRSSAHVDSLLSRLASAIDDLCPIVDALGAIGDPRAVAAVREVAQRKLLSRRRSGIEALRNLDDQVGLDAALERTRGGLSDAIRNSLDEPQPYVDSIMTAIRTVEPKRQAFTLDQLYELNHPVANQAIRLMLTEMQFDRPFVWRYAKSIFKRSMLRHDPVMFGWLAHRIEAQGRVTIGQKATVKSGYDGAERDTMIFSRKTQLYARRLAWRYLRNLARYRPELYTAAAAEAVIHYRVEDGREPRGLVGQFADCYLLNRVLFGQSDRFRFDDRRLRFRFENSLSHQLPSDGREESYPHVWETYPRPFLRILGSARLSVVRDFARRALTRHVDLLPSASVAELILILDSPDEDVIQMAIDEIGDRFSASTPDWALLDRCVGDSRELVLGPARQWVAQTSQFWTRDTDRTITYLSCQDRELREIVIEQTIAALSADEVLRQRFVDQILILITQASAKATSADGTTGGAGDGMELDAVGRVARECLTEELGRRLSRAELLGLVFSSAPAIQAVAAHVLCRDPERAALTSDQLLAIATHEVAAVRAAAIELIRGDAQRIGNDPAILFLMLESDWPDARGAAREFLDQHIDWSQAGFDRIMGLLDSNRPDVQQFGCRVVQEQWQSLDPVLLATRLSEHPHPNMRRFAMKLVAENIPDGAEPLQGLQHFFRIALLELTPDREARDQLISFLTERGLRDIGQARVALRFLEMMLHTQGQQVFESVLQSITRLQVMWPDLETSIVIRQEASS